MTLAQLQSFVLVARHGSVKAAAAELAVTEPAVSVAVSALRKELGDELFVRSGRGIALTPGGRRLAALANEILALAAQAHRELKGSGPLGLRVVATDVVAEHIAPLIELFGAREEGLEIAVETGDGASFAEALEHRRADIALGPNPGTDRVAAAPFLRCRLILVAAPGHPLASRRGLVPSALEDERWLVGQPDLDSTTATGLFFARHGLAPAAVATYSSGAAAIAAAAAGDGIALTPAHSVVDEVRRRALVRLDVRGTPVIEMWHASTLGLGRALPAALAFQRFATTPEATQAISSGRAGAVSDRARPKVHVTLWQSVAARRG
jgi:DNA-binding transcriptional LysR family regulator